MNRFSRFQSFTFKSSAIYTKCMCSGINNYHKSSNISITNEGKKLNASLDLYEVQSQMKFSKTEIVYGIHPVLLSLLKQRRKFHGFYYKESMLEKNEKVQDILKLCQSYKIPSFCVNKRKLSKLAGNDTVHQGVCLEASRISPQPFTNNLSDILSDNSKSKLWLYLDQINDPMNLGAILRSAYYLGVDKIFSSKSNSCPLTNVVSKASSGVMEIYPVYQLEDEKCFFDVLHRHKWSILSSSTQPHSTPLEALEIRQNVLLILGNEGRGISAEIMKHCDTFVTISPNEGCSEHVQSLNVSVASALLVYAIMSKLKNVNR